jgi:5-methylcytosine-specific restriction endonuclease McrA
MPRGATPVIPISLQPRRGSVRVTVAKWGGRRLQRMTRVVQETYGWDCWLCLSPIEASQYSIDHVVPRSKGGEVWDVDNMRPAHIKCNSSRGNRTPKQIKLIPNPSRQW